MNSTSLYWRDKLLPGPQASTGYRTVLFVGTTGAGKTTLIRQLIGTDPTVEPFPATSTFKTTTAETEILCAPGEFYAVAVFAERARVRDEIEECVVAATSAVSEGRPREVACDALAAHTDERLRLEYVLGAQWIDAAVATIEAVLHRRPAGGLGEIVERVRTEPELRDLVDHLLADVATRFLSLRHGQLLTDEDESWPRCWRFTTDDRATLFSAIRRLAGNERGSHGTLLSPLVEAMRVRGPLHPTWAAEIPYLMAVDTEGLGHVPLTAASLPLAVLEQLQRVDRIVVVDDATHPLQAAPIAALRQLVRAGQLDKLALCFTHADEVRGPNITSDEDRLGLLRRTVNQAVRSLREELGEPAWLALSQQLDERMFVVGHLDRRLDTRVAGEAASVAELRRMLEWLRAERATIDLSSFRPAYRLSDLRARLTALADKFGHRWADLLGQTHWRQVQTLCHRIGAGADGYGDLQPVAQLAGEALDAIRQFVERPLRWAEVVPSDEQQLAIFDQFCGELASGVLDRCRRAMVERRAEDWNRAAAFSGPAVAAARIEALTADVFAMLVRTGGDDSLVDEITELVRAAGVSAGFDIGDIVRPTGNVFGTSIGARNA